MKPGAGKKKSVLVAMSGGVDSSVAALLLKEAGYDVVGITMRLWVDPLAEERAGEALRGCCSLESVTDAAKVAARLDIPHYTLNMKELFYKDIVCNFKEEYRQGRTPNPCIECNRSLKFSALLDKAEALGLDYLATGHYCRITRDSSAGIYRLFKGLDPNKDQSYMLYMLGQKELARTLFPLGELTKSEVRKIAEEKGLLVAGKAESQEICFIPDNDYRAFLERECPEALGSGEIVSTDGEVLGHHRGIAFYTIGQRKGLGLTAAQPLYVIRLEPELNRVVVGRADETFCSGLLAGSLNFVSGKKPLDEMAIEVKVRYRAAAVPARLLPPENGMARIIFTEAQRAIAPGQSAVFYQADEVIGGGLIESAIECDKGRFNKNV